LELPFATFSNHTLQLYYQLERLGYKVECYELAKLVIEQLPLTWNPEFRSANHRSAAIRGDGRLSGHEPQ